MHTSSSATFRSLFLLIVLIASTSTFAQNKNKNQDVNVYLSYGVSSFKPLWEDLNTFTASFNTQYVDYLSQPFTQFNTAKGSIFDLGIDLGNRIDIGMRYQPPVNYYNTAMFSNGEGREFRYKQKWSEIYMNFNAIRIWRLYLGLNFGAIFNKGSLYSGYIYANGFKSYGLEKRLNGIFEIDNPLYTGGFQAYFVPIKNVGILFQYQKVGIFGYKSTITTATGDLRDNLDGYGTSYSNHQYTTYQAIDVASSTNSNTYFVGLNNTANAELKGNRFTISLRFNLKIADGNM